MLTGRCRACVKCLHFFTRARVHPLHRCRAVVHLRTSAVGRGVSDCNMEASRQLMREAGVISPTMLFLRSRLS